MTIDPDTKDWTWVLERPCPECAFVASAVTGPQIPRITRECAAAWDGVLHREDVRDRPAPQVWSPLEYACHVRDVCRVMDRRARLMLSEDVPTFPDWDQDETALRERYEEQQPAVVGQGLQSAAEAIAARYEAVPDGAWDRRGMRSNGSAFTVLTLGRYFLHDVVHHLHDVGA
ncbi:DinB family protein [Actinotalea sp. Marseille-Q4924]|uniref:DinB family protein n=1 Tax=Actinotalea sp. Marseille-Q4924 TaxID=2866571 RepID=UPI001CE496C6|nr:DinB family protein [Actinotalea sp. Marseille-Q4924]